MILILIKVNNVSYKQKLTKPTCCQNGYCCVTNAAIQTQIANVFGGSVGGSMNFKATWAGYDTMEMALHTLQINNILQMLSMDFVVCLTAVQLS